MTQFLLAVHVIAAIIAIGPVTVAASMFPPAARRAFSDPADGRAIVRILHRICRIYATVGIVVPVFGLATASSLGVLGDTWLIVSIALTAVAAAILALLVLPRQSAVLVDLDAAEMSGSPVMTAPVRRTAARLAMHTGLFNLLWAAVTVLMIIRPGSTTGV